MISESGEAQGRLPPHAAEAERGVLGCVLLAPKEGLDVALLRIKSNAGVFYDLRNREIWTAMVALQEAARDPDLITLEGLLRERGKLEAIGGLGYLNGLVDAVPSAQQLEVYLDVIMEKWLLRRVRAQVTEIGAEIDRGVEEPLRLVERYQAGALEVAEEGSRAELRPMREPLVMAMELIEKRRQGRQQITGIPTPWWYLNNMTCGMQKGELILVCARPGDGKTALLMDVALCGLDHGVASAVFSMEMTSLQWMERMLASRARIDGQKLRNGFTTKVEMERVAVAGGWVADNGERLWIDDRSELTGQDILVASRRAQRMYGVGLVVVDYAQLLRAVRPREMRHAELSEGSAFLRRTAKELGLVVVVAAQLSRESERERGRRPPILADIKDCGQFEQDAHQVWMLYEPPVKKDDEHEMRWLEHHEADDPKQTSTYVKEGKEAGWREELRRINLMVGKNRMGPTGLCELVFQRRSMRFADAHSPRRGGVKPESNAETEEERRGESREWVLD